ncbi:hypothetical protein Tco_0269292 [Tanacetum coccineum]
MFKDTAREQLKTNNNNNRTRGRTLVGPTLKDVVRRSHAGDLNPYALNAIITTMVHELLNATSATELAIWPVTVGVLPMPTLLTTRRALGRVRSLHAMSVEWDNAPAKVYAVGHTGTNPDSNVVTVTSMEMEDKYGEESGLRTSDSSRFSEYSMRTCRSLPLIGKWNVKLI